MTNKRKRSSRLVNALLETARDMRRSSIIGDAAFAKITMRHIGSEQPAARQTLSAKEIKSLRKKARMSQAVFARHLNVTPGYVSQLERGAKHPTGAALALLNIIRRKGIDVIL